MSKKFLPDQHHYYKNGKLIAETGHSDWLIHLFYSTKIGRVVRLLFVKGLINRMCEWYYNSKWSKRKIDPFIKKYAIDMNLFQIPQNGFSSFNDFFTRKLKDGARDIDPNPNSITSMGDCKIFVIPEIKKDSYFLVKNIALNLDKILGDASLAAKYYGGELLMLRLSMYDYHRFHFPFDCSPSAPRLIKGQYDTVSPLIYNYGVFPLVYNQRLVVPCTSKQFGEALIVLIGAFLVGKTICTYEPGKHYKKGQEMGYFTFGGSTILIIFPPHKISIFPQFLENSQKGYETAILMGDPIAAFRA